MSQPQSMTRVIESLQRTLHELVDLHLKSGRPFNGITISALPLQYRDTGVSIWDVTFAPHQPVEEVEETIVEEDADEPEDDEDATLEEAFVEGFAEGRQE